LDAVLGINPFAIGAYLLTIIAILLGMPSVHGVKAAAA